MKRRILTGSVVATLIVLAFTARSWLPPSLRFIGTNADVIQSITSLVQLVIWLVAGLGAFEFWRTRSLRTQPKETGPEKATSVSNDFAGGVIDTSEGTPIATSGGSVRDDRVK
jgi:hypothetical protein